MSEYKAVGQRITYSIHFALNYKFTVLYDFTKEHRNAKQYPYVFVQYIYLCCGSKITLIFLKASS